MSEQQQPGDIDPSVPPSGEGCVECLAAGGWWVHLRRCARCGHIGCCDTSLGQHASGHARTADHPVIRSYEPGESWFFDFRSGGYVDDAPELAPPLARPETQPAPGPAGRVPADWLQQVQGRR
jgi:hypothetical protein